jgi:hypothetical protein
VHVVICGEVGAEEILETDLVWTTTRLADHNTHLCLERQHIHMIAHEVFLLQPLDNALHPFFISRDYDTTALPQAPQVEKEALHHGLLQFYTSEANDLGHSTIPSTCLQVIRSQKTRSPRYKFADRF